jgi:hypothetical protein
VIDDSAEDKGLGKLIAGKLREQLRAEDAGCPDAETLACYYDHVLTEDEREACATHITLCSRCQEQIAELARLSDADGPLVAVMDKPVAEEEPETGWHFSLAWVGFALVIVVSVGVWQRSRIVNFLQPQRETAENVSPPAPEAPAVAGEKAVPSNQPARHDAAKATDAIQSKVGGASKIVAEEKAGSGPGAKVPSAVAKSKEASPAGALARNTALAETQSASGGSAGVVAEGRKADGLGAMAAPSERASLGAVVQPGGRQIEMRAEKPNLRLTDRDVAGERLAAAPQPPPAPAKAAKGEVGAAQDEASAGAPKITVQGFAFSYTPKWRVGQRGLIQKAEPNGNWVTVPSGVNSDLFDITFAGFSAGWAVGHEGLVLRTSDGGITWSRTASPSSEDLIHVSAKSEFAARVITRQNKLFSTTDGGKSWTSIPQE